MKKIYKKNIKRQFKIENIELKLTLTQVGFSKQQHQKVKHT